MLGAFDVSFERLAIAAGGDPAGGLAYRKLRSVVSYTSTRVRV